MRLNDSNTMSTVRYLVARLRREEAEATSPMDRDWIHGLLSFVGDEESTNEFVRKAIIYLSQFEEM